MSYIATLSACLLGRVPVDDNYLTSKGSSHGANKFFPDHYDSTQDWQAWLDTSITNYTIDGLCIIKDSWVGPGIDVIAQHINHNQSLAIISKSDHVLDWFYTWLNMCDKIPKHIYYNLCKKSMLYPKLWYSLKKQKKISEFISAMPLYGLDPGPQIQQNCWYVQCTDVCQTGFADDLCQFLHKNDLPAIMSHDIKDLHQLFISKQKHNLNMARELAQGHRWTARGPWDEVLFGYLDKLQNGAMGS